MSYRIIWKEKKTGKEGRGFFAYRTKRDAEEIASRLNRQFQNVSHWVEKEKKTDGATHKSD